MKVETLRRKTAELLGIADALPEPEPVLSEQAIWERDTISLEAEAVLLYYETPNGNKFVLHQFRNRNCKYCEKEFITSLGAVAYCSDDCRQKALQEIGIEWNPDKSPEERWAGVDVDRPVNPKDADEIALKRQNSVPLVITPEATSVLQMIHPPETQIETVESEPETEQTQLVPDSILQLMEDRRRNDDSTAQLLRDILGE